ncbi:MAG: tetratricopeptide repeat protein [Planctomycetota bacterium]|jgi:predicted Zn-dependent protease
MKMTYEPETDLLSRIGGTLLRLRDLVAATVSMYWTRNWLLIYSLVLLNFLFIGIPLVPAVLGHFWPLQSTKISRFAGLAAQEDRDSSIEGNWSLPSLDIRLPSIPLKFKNTPLQNLLFPKLAMLGDKSADARFGLAMTLVDCGQISQARPVINALAAEKNLPLAHLWLARDMLTASNRFDIQAQNLLVGHLAAAFESSDAPPEVAAIYSQILWGLGQNGPSKLALSRNVKRCSALKFPLAQLLESEGDTTKAAELRNQFEAELTEKITNRSLSFTELNSTITILEISRHHDDALRWAARGRGLFPDNSSLSLRYSDLLLAKFRKSLRTENESGTLELGILEQAIQADPLNLRLESELKYLLEISRKLSPNARGQLSRDLKEGNYPVVLNVIFGLEQLERTNFDEAERYLSSALSNAPNCPFVMNRLVDALIEHSNRDFKRAEGLAVRSLEYRKMNPVYWKSLGQVYSLQKQSQKAIEVLDSAVNQWPQRADFRELLAVELEAEGRRSEAARQREIGRELQ